MTDDEWAAIKPLADAKAEAQAAMTAWQFQNTPVDHRAYIEMQSIGMRLKEEYAQACRAMEAALAAIRP